MNFTVSHEKPAKLKSDCIVVGVFSSRTLSSAARQLDNASRGELSEMLKLTSVTGKVGESVTLYSVRGLACNRVVLVGCGARRGLSDRDYERVLTRVASELGGCGATSAALALDELKVTGRSRDWQRQQAIELIHDRDYRFDELKSRAERAPRPKLRRLQLLVAKEEEVQPARESVARGVAVAHGVALARDLGNRPGNICTPSYLATQARSLARRHSRLKAKVLGEADMKRLGMGALLSVSAGSRQPAKLIVIEYSGAAKGEQPVVLVGKGVTFDSGGISIKPAAAMDEMKFDMCGAASVLGVMEAVCEMSLPVHLVGIIPATENLPDGQATKPGDVVTSMSGQTIEVLNTDAEGRLILCDALTYAKRFEPEIVIDIATLTGACVVALGAHASGLFSNDDALANALLEAGERAGDRAWRMPLWPEYDEQIKSNFADVANTGGREAGAVTAASFLARFCRHYRWAHLDIAGSAWKTGKSKGATGRPVPLLCEYLVDRCRH